MNMDWQPIETVPRDGKESFLVRYRSGLVAHVYLTTPEPPLAQTFRYAGGPCSGQQAGWPEYWMPTPALTAADAERKRTT